MPMPRRIIVCSAVLIAASLWGQSPDPAQKPAANSVVESTPAARGSGGLGLGVKVSPLGVGAEAAARLTRRTNLRAGFNILNYGATLHTDGVDYAGNLGFKTLEAHYDIFPWAGSLHLGPGLLVFMGDPITAHAALAGNQSFSLGGQTYYSDPKSPANLHGSVNFNRVAPMLTVGWGNLVHRDSKHFTIPFEIGLAFLGSPRATLGLGGSVCDSPGSRCRNVGSDFTVLNRVLSEAGKISGTLSPFQVYPVISIGIGYTF